MIQKSVASGETLCQSHSVPWKFEICAPPIKFPSRSLTGQINTKRIIAMENNEIRSTLFIMFVDFTKTSTGILCGQACHSTTSIENSLTSSIQAGLLWIEDSIARRQFCCIHFRHWRGANNIRRQALTWNLQSIHSVGRPKPHWEGTSLQRPVHRVKACDGTSFSPFPLLGVNRKKLWRWIYISERVSFRQFQNRRIILIIFVWSRTELSLNTNVYHPHNTNRSWSTSCLRPCNSHSPGSC